MGTMGRAKVRTPLRAMLGSVRGAPLVPRMRLRFPGVSHAGPAPALSASEALLARALRGDVERLAGEFAGRNLFRPGVYASAAGWLESRLAGLGLAVRRQAYTVNGVECVNLDAQIDGRERPDQIVVVGSHYDAIELEEGGCPAANDNGSGVAATLALAERLVRRRDGGSGPSRSVRFVLFANEEPPFFWTPDMGSLVYAGACRARGENIVAMLTPETMGCYSDEPGSQRYPPPMSFFYPNVGNFVAFIGMHEAAGLVSRCVEVFRATTPLACEGAALPAIVPRVGASDHWSFWRQGYPAVMVTDTAPYRYRQYHTMDDVPGRMDFDRFARAVDGLGRVVEALADGP